MTVQSLKLIDAISIKSVKRIGLSVLSMKAENPIRITSIRRVS